MDARSSKLEKDYCAALDALEKALNNLPKKNLKACLKHSPSSSLARSGTRFWQRASRTTSTEAGAPQIGLEGEGSFDCSPRRGASKALCPPGLARSIATGESLVRVTREALPWFPESAFLAEPVARNTAACIGWASAIIRRRDPEALIAALPSDQLMDDEPGFRAAVTQAFKVAEETAPSSPWASSRTSARNRLRLHRGRQRARRRREPCRALRRKPTRAGCRRLPGGERENILWNAGMFFFRAQSMLDAIEKHMPKLAEGIERIEKAAKRGKAEAERAKTVKVFDGLESVSIDYGIMGESARANRDPAADALVGGDPRQLAHHLGSSARRMRRATRATMTPWLVDACQIIGSRIFAKYPSA